MLEKQEEIENKALKTMPELSEEARQQRKQTAAEQQEAARQQKEQTAIEQQEAARQQRKQTAAEQQKERSGTEAPEVKPVLLSKRLQALANMVTPGLSVCDVGCDHGFLAIYLVQKQIAPRVFAMDLRTGPLAGAKKHISAYGLEEQITTRLSDGLEAMEIGEAQAMVCAGMGGALMASILQQESEKAHSLKELILQPQSEVPIFRTFLRDAGYEIAAEDIVEEEGKFYPMMKVVPVNVKQDESNVDKSNADKSDADKSNAGKSNADKSDADKSDADKSDAGKSNAGKSNADKDSMDPKSACVDSRNCGNTKKDEAEEGNGKDCEEISITQTQADLFGGLLLARRHPVLMRYLLEQKRILSEILSNLTGDSERIIQKKILVEMQLYQVEKALALYETKG